MSCESWHRIFLVTATLLLVMTGCAEQRSNDQPSPDGLSERASSRFIASTTVPAVRPAETSVSFDVDARRPARKLSDYGLFDDLEKQTLSAGVIPYELNALSYLDGARQESFVFVPPGQAATYQSENALSFPVGSVLIQNLWFPAETDEASREKRYLETRLLLHNTDGWTAVPYSWNDEGTDADRVVIGNKTPVTRTTSSHNPHSFTFLTPNMNECKNCHVNEDVMSPMGVTAANLNRMTEVDGAEINQLEYWQQIGLLEGLPEDRSRIPQIPDWSDESSATVERRARSWLDVNCSHCHNPRGAASTSGLDLTYEQSQPVRFGVYKPPVAAGRGSQGLKFSILPQKPDESFLIRRIGSTELGVMMPPLGRTTVDHDGVALLRQWIAEMEVDEALAEAALNPMKAYKDALVGGDAELGKALFHKTQKCIACHRVGQEGGSIGPNLSDVGKRVKRDYILESIVDPSAKIVKGFETHAFVLGDGRVLTGTIVSEDEYEIVVGHEGKQTKIQKSEIEERLASEVSTMPTLANLLSVDDVRNLISYLVTLQDTPSP